MSHDTKHDGVFADPVLHDVIDRYDINSEDLWIQRDNTSSQDNNKHSFGLLQQSADEIGLRIIRNYSDAGHGKGAIDGMSSFEV